jgi:hypothetical protein
MSSLPLVAVIGSRIASEKAAELGYGERELEMYPTSSLGPICDSGLLPVGLAVKAQVGGLRLCDVVSGLVVLHQGPSPAGISGGAEEARKHPALPFVIRALSRQLPVLAVGSGEFLLAAALAGLVRERLADDLAARSVPIPMDASTHDRDWSDALGVSGGRSLPTLVQTNTVPDGMRSVASGPDGSVYAVASSDASFRLALSVRWDPQTLPAHHDARYGPFRWLRDQAARQQSLPEGEEEYLPAQGEVR